MYNLDGNVNMLTGFMAGSRHKTLRSFFSNFIIYTSCSVCEIKYLLMFVLQGTWWALLLLLPLVRPFYVPGVAPRDFHDGDIVDIKV